MSLSVRKRVCASLEDGATASVVLTLLAFVSSTSHQYTITSFCIDVSPSMGAQRSITEHVDTGDHAGATNGASDGAESSDSATRTRVTSDLEWVMELVARKIQNCVSEVERTLWTVNTPQRLHCNLPAKARI